MTSRLTRQLEASSGEPGVRDHQESDQALRRRRLVVIATLAVGAVLLSLSLSTRPGDPLFYLLTLALASTWAGGAFLSGPLHAGWVQSDTGPRRSVLQPIAVGLAAVAVFGVGALLVGQVPFLEHRVDSVLAHAQQGWLPLIAVVTVVNGLAEELFFRGALYAAIGRFPVIVSTVVYALTTTATGNVMLVFAAVVLGVLVGVQRRVSGGVQAPIITHVTWSVGMLLLLPPMMGPVV